VLGFNKRIKQVSFNCGTECGKRWKNGIGWGGRWAISLLLAPIRLLRMVGSRPFRMVKQVNATERRPEVESTKGSCRRWEAKSVSIFVLSSDGCNYL